VHGVSSFECGNSHETPSCHPFASFCPVLRQKTIAIAQRTIALLQRKIVVLLRNILMLLNAIAIAQRTIALLQRKIVVLLNTIAIAQSTIVVLQSAIHLLQRNIVTLLNAIAIAQRTIVVLQGKRLIFLDAIAIILTNADEQSPFRCTDRRSPQPDLCNQGMVLFRMLMTFPGQLGTGSSLLQAPASVAPKRCCWWM
jgi:hypothetical protein